MFRAALLSAVNKERFGLRVDRLRPPPPFRYFPDTSTPLRLPLRKFRDPSALLRIVELHCIYGYKLSLTATLSLSPTPPASLRCRPASVPLSTRHRLWRFAPLLTPLAFLSPQASKALRDNRLVDAVPLLSILRSARAANLHVPPTHIGSCPCHSVRRLSLFTVCDAKPHASFVGSPGPDGRYADALTSLRQTANRLCQLRVASGSRRGGVGKLSNRKRILEIACRFVALHDTPLRCSRQAANAPLAVSPPFRATSSSPPIATFSPST